jgi:hypothetical protein
MKQGLGSVVSIWQHICMFQEMSLSSSFGAIAKERGFGDSTNDQAILRKHEKGNAMIVVAS